MTYTTKSVIIDAADCWGGTTNIMGIRSVEFSFEGSVLALTASDYTAYATTINDVTWRTPSMVFDTSVSKTGTTSSNQWLSVYASGNDTDQRLIVVFDTEQTFDSIIINNSHESGTETSYGIKNATIKISPDTITSTVYDEAITNFTLIFDGEFEQHISTDVADDKLLLLEGTEWGAKSIIMDVADCWGSTNYMSMRSVDFYYQGSLITELAANFTAYATSTINASYPAEHVFDTSLSKTGDWTDTTWVASVGSYTNQRLIVVFDTAIVFDQVIISNSHHSGTSTDTGLKNVKIYLSSDSITSTVYDEEIANSFMFFDGQFAQHTAVDEVDPQNLELIVREPVPYTFKSIILDIADNYGDAIFMAMRSINFYYESNSLGLEPADYTAYSTTNFTTYYPSNMFDTSQDYTAALTSSNIWYSNYPGGYTTNQRVIIVFDSPQSFDSIRIVNAHDGGYETDRGLQNVKINGSTDTITDTTYDAAITNSTLIFDDTFTEHSSSNTELPETLKLIPKYSLTETIVVPEVELTIEVSLTVLPPGAVLIPEIELLTEVGSSISINKVVVLPEVELTIEVSAAVYTDTVIVAPEVELTIEVSIEPVDIFSLKNTAQIYIFTLTGAEDGVEDLVMPMSNFQFRTRSGVPSFLTATIPTYDYAEEIALRTNGVLKIDIAYNYKGTTLQRTPLVEVDFDMIMTHEGPSSQSIIIQGYRTETYTKKSIVMEGLQYRNLTDGKYRYRLSKPYPYLNPGDEVTIGYDTFDANVISYYIGPLVQNMEISEE